MLAVRCLVRLYEVPPEYGKISAFDTHGGTIFAGTDRGLLLKLVVAGASSFEAARQAPQSRCAGSDNAAGNSRAGALAPPDVASAPLSASAEASEMINTTLVRFTLLSTMKRKIERIQHSRTHTLLFVLYEHRLVVLNSVTFSHLQTIAEHVGTFFVSDSQQNSPQRAGLHVICASELNGKGLSVFEFDASQAEGARAILAQELVLPEPVQALVTYGSIACVGMRREYSLLSLSDGSSCGVLPLGGGKQPLLAAGDGEVFMRYNHSIFSVSMRSMPSGRVLGRTIQLKDEPLSFVVRHPFLFVFTEHYCDVFSLYDDDMSGRLMLPGCLFSSQLGRGDFLYAASKTKIWMASLHSLRQQLANLVEHFKVEEAFHLLGSQRARGSLDLQGIELELHIMAGYAYLHHCRPKEAMLHFNDHIDPRDLLLSLLECIPPGPDEYSPELRALLATRPLKAENAVAASKTENITAPTSGVAGTRDAQAAKVAPEKEKRDILEGHGEVAQEVSDDADGGYWAQWEGPCPYNTYAGELHHAWLETFETFPLVPSGGDAEREVIYRQVTEWGAVTATAFLEHAWELFKDEVILYFRSRLRQSSDVCARAMEYALLVLALEAQDHRAAYRVVACGSSIRLEDCYDLLASLREYRLLACLLFRRGYVREANALLARRVYVSSILPPPEVRPPGAVGARSPAYTILPEAMHVHLDRLLNLSPTSPCPGAARTQTWGGGGRGGGGGGEGSLNVTPLPSSLTEAMYLVSKLNLPALRELLQEDLAASCTVDEEGCSLLHVLFGLLVLLESSDDDVTSEGKSALLNLVLSCAILLLDHGAPVSVVSTQGLSCLDVVALAAGDAVLDIILAALLADKEVKDIAAAVEKGKPMPVL
ncbi:uncharacterized protein Tco025E_02224 [Trypanosoma conorhini]|uniref:CNH domain-containing protein n=1 Tax=Trypanosoma conorhini TaxID=83891 RepID=A0A3R7PUG9_9TRYP|nr:uncharacterized protein Tco025E_02224 [Trypanosoma conorhini]RNF25341.1 hypothetical protein Tco025E_02224 [Trypanosoma conorhini]